MKNFLRFILILAVCCWVSACQQKRGRQNDAQIRFQETLHDFGTVDLNTEVSHDFAFTNPGEESLMIQDIQTSCGCTAARWPKKPIEKGEKEKINIVYEADLPGAFRKSITVYYNGKDSPEKLFIKGETKKTVE